MLPRQVAALREAVLYLVRSTETALHTFKRSYAWREAAKVGERWGTGGRGGRCGGGRAAQHLLRLPVKLLLRCARAVEAVGLLP